MAARLAIALFSLALIGAGSASARAPIEEQLSSDDATGLLARGGWITWVADEKEAERVLWRDGRLSPFPRVEPWALGTDARGRTEALYMVCSRGCAARGHRLAGGADRLLFRRPGQITGVAERRGALAWSTGAGVYFRARGAKRARKVMGGYTRLVGMGDRRLLVRAEHVREDEVRIVALDLTGRRVRKRVLAADGRFDDDCRCTAATVSVSDPQIDGRFAYWLETTHVARDGGSVGNGPSDASSRVLRVALARRSSVVEEFIPAHTVSVYGALAIDRGSVIYGAMIDASGLFRVAAPAWSETNDPLPVRR
jgi:hypothetical protein